MKGLKCFISYHHRKDQKYVKKLRKIYKQITVLDYSLKKDISYLSEESIYDRIKFSMNNSAVTIVLIGKETAMRKWIDWEIWASLVPYRNKALSYREGFRPCGIVAIFLPGCNNKKYIPKRLQDNIDSKYVVSMDWSSVQKNLKWKLTMAYRRRKYTSLIKNTRKRVERNKYRFFGLSFPEIGLYHNLKKRLKLNINFLSSNS